MSPEQIAKEKEKMKSILISIRPRWCELIASGYKTVEVRKTRPKIETTFRCYIYCTKSINGKGDVKNWGGKVIGEFVCNDISVTDWTVKSEYELREPDDIWLYETQLTDRELFRYSKGKRFYGWRISGLLIYDKPKDLSDFVVPSKIGCCNEGKCEGCKFFDGGYYYSDLDDCVAEFDTDEYAPLRKAPQSWCYVEELWREK